MIRRVFFALIAGLATLGAVHAQSLDKIIAGAEGGVAEAQYLLGERYRTGTGVLQNYARAAAWHLAAAEQGDLRAMHKLGRLLISGLGVSADPVNGIALLEQAANSGDGEALFDLASAYEQGVAGEPDYENAIAVYEIAVSRGSQDAAVSLANLSKLARAPKGILSARYRFTRALQKTGTHGRKTI